MRAARLLSLLALCLLVSLPASSLAAARPAADRFAPERPFALGSDDWEPAVAADASGHVYIVTTRYGGRRACGHCPDPALVLRSSADGGRSFGPARFLCSCAGVGGQNDPQIEVDRRGRVYAAWMNDWRVSFSRSDDHGRHWSRPVDLHGRLSFSDKPTLTVSRSGEDVYVVYNGPSAGDPYAVASHDAGRHWTAPRRILAGPLYFFSGGSTVLPDGTVLAAQDVYRQDNTGPVLLEVLRSSDGGRRWTHRLVGRSAQARDCLASAGCPTDSAFLGEQAAIASDAAGRAYVLFTAARRQRGPARLLMRSSDDGGRSWSRMIYVAAEPGVDHEFPMIAAGRAGDVRVAWMDERRGRWNVRYRRSSDGGRSWSAMRRLSDRAGGAPYKSRLGFAFPYGDYGEIALDGRGRAHVAWGEGPSYEGPGGTWFTRELP